MSTIWNAPMPDPDYDANQAKRVAIFTKIAPTPNWKDKIDAWIFEGEVEECTKAAAFFCGSPLQVVEWNGSKVRVKGPGYYACVGA